MPDGIGISPEDFNRVRITLEEYLQLYVNFINEMVDFGAMSVEDVERYNERVRAYFQRLYPGREEIRKAYVLDPQTQVSLQQLPFFKQVVAPVVYRNEAIRKAGQYGYTEDDPQYATLLRNAIDAGEEFQRGYINEWLDYKTATAEREVTTAIGARRAELEKEVAFFQAGQRQLQGLREQAGLEAQRRAEAWVGEEEVARIEREARVTERVGVRTRAEEEVARMRGETVREFLEEERPAGIQAFIRGELPGVLEEFEREQEGARRAWWSALARPVEATYEQRLREAEFEEQRWEDIRVKGLKEGLGAELKVRAAGLGRPLTRREMTPEEYYFTVAQRKRREYQAEAEALRGYTPERIARMGREPEPVEDPLRAYLAQYPWQAEFFKLSPAQRGFRPSMYAPSARWFV